MASGRSRAGGVRCDTSVGFQIKRRLAGFCPPPPPHPVSAGRWVEFRPIFEGIRDRSCWPEGRERGGEGTEGEMELTEGESGPLRPVGRYQSHP